jgi:polysaccharide biosynthesis/export protein
LLVDPVVTVNIAEYSKRPISVVGAVRHPLTFDALEQITLLDALARAEGLNAEAGREILITRPPSEPGQPQTIRRVAVRDLIEEAKSEANLVLQGGEEVRVPETGRVFVVGNVRKPGAFRLTDGETVSVLQAIALAEGLAPFSTREAYIYRPSADGTRTEIVVPLRKVLNRKSADVFLEASDILYVPDNRKGRLTTNAIERALTFASGTASGALILGVNR